MSSSTEHAGAVGVPAIANATLFVDLVPSRPNHRLLRVSYDIDLDAAVTDRVFDCEVTVVSVDAHDAPVHPDALRVELASGPLSVASGGEHRQHGRAVPRVDLDVSRDWWDTGQSGETEPIAEFADHLIGRIRLLRDGVELTSADTNMVTGSWGALGSS